VNSILVLLIGAVAIAAGYFWYARTINRSVVQPDDKKATPAKMYMDGVDFTPANRNVLFGYQFKSIAALGPILGPIIAVQWGWLPALLWIVVGTFFIGWVQDYASIMIGVREEGNSFGALSYQLISPRSRGILITFIYFYLWLIMGSFGTQVGFNLLTNTAVPLGVITVILVGILAGQMTYKWKQDIILTSVITVVLAFVGIWLGTLPAVQSFFRSVYGMVQNPETGAWVQGPPLFGAITQARLIGSLLVMVICYFGAVLPIWRWAQPINYVAFWIVLLGVAAGTLGLLIWRPGMGDFPAFTNWTGNLCTAGVDCAAVKEAGGSVPGALGWLWPILFVTIACGAISGWHSLVSSSGTARQLEKESDALFVGGGSMFLEMFFACVAFLTATVAFSGTEAGNLMGYVAAGGSAAPAKVFTVGLATFLSKVGIPAEFGVPYGAVFLTLMALTIMYLVVRFMRVASAEALGARVPIIKNVHVGTLIALLLTLALIWLVPFLQIWVMFGAANQMMASLALLLVTLWLMKSGKNWQWTFWPFVFMFITTLAALLYKVWESFFVNLPNAATKAVAPVTVGQYQVAQITIGVIAVVLIVAALFLAYDGMVAFRKARAKPAPKAKAKAGA